MSLIIKGMQLPQSCSTCRFSYFTVGIRKRCEISGDEVNPLIDCRETNCPLVEIPTPHGRLIDADRFLDWLKEFHPNDVVIMSGVKNARTVIEAEVSE